MCIYTHMYMYVYIHMCIYNIAYEGFTWLAETRPTAGRGPLGRLMFNIGNLIAYI